MKFSVLLPTRNGDRYLGTCLKSIVDQVFQDMEVIVFDNANTDQTANVIKPFLADLRVKYYRTDHVVSVTENWNNALKASSGDYVLMIGDDDYLLPGYFSTMDSIIERYNFPDGVSYNGYTFIYPGAIDNNLISYYSDPHFQYKGNLDGEIGVTEKELRPIVIDMFKFNNRIPLNTLPHLWSRKVIDKVAGDLFRPPYPDHFALNSLLLKAESWVFSPEKLYIIGVSPKSYGHFVFSDDEQKKGEEYLGISGEFTGQLPGNPLINNMWVWLELLKDNYPEDLDNIDISRVEYVKHQAHYWVSQYKHGSIDYGVLLGRIKMLSLSDMIGLVSVLWDSRSMKALWLMLKKRNPSKLHTFYYGPRPANGIMDSKELFENIIRDQMK